MRGWIIKTLTLALAAGGLQAVAVADPAWACGCGAYIPGPGGTAQVAQEQAIVRYDGTTEDVVMRFSVRSTTTDAAWVMPVPGPATVKLSQQALFNDLTIAEMPRTVVHHYFWPHLGSGDGSLPSAGGARAAAPPSAPAVQVLNDQRIGEFEVANLAATDPKALGDWLTAHKFALKTDTGTRLAAYTAEGWQFVAVRLDSGTPADLNGALDPIRISFAAKSAVYPMRLSAGATTPQHVSIAVLAPHRMDVTRDPIAGETESSWFGDWVDPSQVGPELGQLAGGRMFLTDYTTEYEQPSQITQDFAFAPAASDWVQHSTTDQEELLRFLGIPVYLLVLAALVIGFAVVLRWATRRQTRDSSPHPA